MPAEPRSAHAARDLLQQRFQEWELAELIDEAQVALSELVTNGVLHARTPLLVSLSTENGMVEIAVCDGSPVLPELRPHRADLNADLDRLLETEVTAGEPLDDRDPRLHVGAAGTVAGGRGLLLVEALAAEWGVSPLSDGKAVWIRTPAPTGWRYRVGCPCSDSGEAAQLASGRPVAHRG